MRMLSCLAALALLLFAARSEAAILTAGNIFPVFDGGSSQISTTVDHWGFTVNTAGTIVMDILSWEGAAVDVNGDGEIAFFDPFIYLMRDDGSLEDVKAKEKKYAEFVESTGYQSARLMADAWCAAFVWTGARWLNSIG